VTFLFQPVSVAVSQLLAGAYAYVRRGRKDRPILSHDGSAQDYVSASAGSWGPPVRPGTRTGITLIKVVAAWVHAPAAKAFLN
jgi:hypothetical protein